MATIEIQVPDIGDFDEVTVIELMVKVGDTVRAEQSLITVESDKASMEIPSAAAGVVKEMQLHPPHLLLPHPPALPHQRLRLRLLHQWLHQWLRHKLHRFPHRLQHQPVLLHCPPICLARRCWPCRTHHPRCASLRVSLACLWKKSRAKGPKAALRKTMCKPLPKR